MSEKICWNTGRKDIFKSIKSILAHEIKNVCIINIIGNY